MPLYLAACYPAFDQKKQCSGWVCEESEKFLVNSFYVVIIFKYGTKKKKIFADCSV